MIPPADHNPPRASRRPPPRSAAVLAYRRRPTGPEFLLVHPGGPFWTRRDLGAWSVPKGLIEDGEDELTAAVREFEEEVGIRVDGRFARLADRRQKAGKLVLCWMVEADLDLAAFCSNTFEMEWPPRSGRIIHVPECDRAEYFGADKALDKILPAQRGFIEEAVARIDEGNE
jgi:predicted NUDIX family NTP pyrophosphohydrolase